MKRDCGPGELKPIAWVVVHCIGMNDDEYESSHATLDFAKSVYDARRLELANSKYSNVRLYAKDKQGYMNCILSWSQDIGETRNRITEL